MKTRRLDWYETLLYKFAMGKLDMKVINTDDLVTPEDFKEPCKDFKDLLKE